MGELTSPTVTNQGPVDCVSVGDVAVDDHNNPSGKDSLVQVKNRSAGEGSGYLPIRTWQNVMMSTRSAIGHELGYWMASACLVTPTCQKLGTTSKPTLSDHWILNQTS